MKVKEDPFWVSTNYVGPDICTVEVKCNKDEVFNQDPNKEVKPNSNIFILEVVFLKDKDVDSTIVKFKVETLNIIYPKAEDILKAFLQKKCGLNQEIMLALYAAPFLTRTLPNPSKV